MSWTKEEMEAADVKTRKLLTMHGGFHPRDCALAGKRLDGAW